MDVGRAFERQIQQSCKKQQIYYRKLADTFVLNEKNGQKTQISPYDAIAFYDGALFLLEMKSTDSKSFSIQRNPEDKGGMIKFHQMYYLNQHEQEYEDIYSYLVLNFRATEDRENATFLVPIQKFLNHIADTNKKSINYSEVEAIGTLIPQKKLRTNYLYDIKSILE